ncbi:MAG TPA: nitroreductase family protein [Sphingomonas sp.]
MDLLETIYTRRAIRDYREDAIPDDVLEAVLEDAVHAPSSNNRQAWSFLIVVGRDRLTRYSDAALATMPAERSAVLRAHLEAGGSHGIFHNAPALVIVCATGDDPMVAQDCCIAGQTLMLAAHGKGLGTCWIGSADPWLATPAAHAELAIPQGHIPVAPIIIGYPRTIPEPTSRSHPQIRWIGKGD